jgi:hypothetical protein
LKERQLQKKQKNFMLISTTSSYTLPLRPVRFTYDDLLMLIDTQIKGYKIASFFDDLENTPLGVRAAKKMTIEGNPIGELTETLIFVWRALDFPDCDIYFMQHNTDGRLSETFFDYADKPYSKDLAQQYLNYLISERIKLK